MSVGGRKENRLCKRGMLPKLTPQVNTPSMPSLICVVKKEKTLDIQGFLNEYRTRPRGFEPPTCSLGNCRSILLSYGRIQIPLFSIPQNGLREEESLRQNLGGAGSLLLGKCLLRFLGPAAQFPEEIGQLGSALGLQYPADHVHAVVEALFLQ